MNNNEKLLELRNDAVPRGVGIQTAHFIDRAANAELWDVDGNRFIDLGSGIAVVGTGHAHPKVIAAVQAQLERFTHTCFQVTPYEAYVKLAASGRFS